MAKSLSRLLKQPNDSVAAATLVILNCAQSTQSARANELMELAYERSERIAVLLHGTYAPSGPLGKAIMKARDMLRSLQDADDPLVILAELTGCKDSSLSDRDDSEEIAVEDKPLGLEEGKVSIRTTHSCKGLEADVVFIPGVEPGSYERDDVGARREEHRRRLFVAITRGIARVYLSYAGQRTGTVRYADATGDSLRKGPSTFIDDICSRSEFAPTPATQYIADFLAE